MPLNRRKALPFICLVLSLSCAWLFVVLPHGYAQGGAQRFEPADCPVDVPDHPQIDCGYLTVPEDHADPAGPTIQLPIIIIHSTSADPHPDPILYTEGGPGYSSLSSVGWLSRSALVDDRDIIILEQRGNIYAHPSLECDPLVWLEEAEGNTTCLDSLHERGINLTHYTTQQNAADVDALRRALNIERWNLYGSSYSTRLFLYVMQQYPEGVRSAALDSVSPPSENRYLHDPEHSFRALQKLFDDCSASEACEAAYPDLEARFYELFSRLNLHPVKFPITYDTQGHRLEEPLTEEVSGYTLLEWMVSDAFYGPSYGGEKTSYLPLLIGQVEAGRTELLYPWLMDQIFSGWGSMNNFAWGLYFAINCQNDFPAVTPERLEEQSAEYPQLEGYIRHAREVEICALWDLPADPLAPEPLQSDIPTLVLAGGYDPITPPEWGRITAEDFCRSYYFEFPAAGHGVAGESACARDIQIAFLADPEREPDASCLADEPEPDFVLPSEVLLAPGFYHSVTDINLGVPSGKPWLEAVATAALLLFIVEIGFLLVSGIIRWVQRRKEEPPQDLAARITHPLAGLVAALGLTVPVLMTDINHTLNNNPMMRYFGLPAAYPPATLLGIVAPLFMLLCVVLVMLTAYAWVKQYWSLAQRSLLLLVATMTVVFSMLIVRWGLATLLL